MISVLLFMLHAAVSEIWTEPSLVNVTGERSAWAGESGRIYAAQGESESFQLCVSGGRKGRQGLRVEAGAIDEVIGAPRIYRVGMLHAPKPSPRAMIPAPLCPDVLFPADALDLAPHELAVFWITYLIPPETKRGVYSGTIQVLDHRRRAEKIGVRVEVFGFPLPQPPTLGSRTPLDRLAIRSTYGVDATALAAWKPIYETLRGFRLSFELWDGGPLNPIGAGGAADTGMLKQHLEFAVSALEMGGVALGGDCLAAFPAPEPGASLDPLAAYLRDMSTWLNDKKWKSRAYVCFPIPERRDAWKETRELCERVARTGEPIARLMTGPPHPYFERYADRWALPFHSYSPDLIFRLSHGLSLSGKVALPLQTITSSSCGALPGHAPGLVTRAEEICDGSLYSGWAAGRPPAAKNPEWVTLRFATPVITKTLHIVWAQGCPVQPIEVSFARDSENFGPAAIHWQHRPAQPFDFAVSSGRFKFENEITALRLSFRGGAEKGPLSILEATLNAPETPPPPNPVASIQPWLQIVPDRFPSVNADAHPMEARAIGWICWGHSFSGIALPAFNTWPAAWLSTPRRDAAAGLHAGCSPDFLVYPGPAGLMPSVRLERLRDGLEDYEYLHALSSAQQQGVLLEEEVVNWTQRRLYRFAPPPQELDSMAEQIMDARINIGRALDRIHQKSVE